MRDKSTVPILFDVGGVDEFVVGVEAEGAVCMELKGDGLQEILVRTVELRRSVFPVVALLSDPWTSNDQGQSAFPGTSKMSVMALGILPSRLKLVQRMSEPRSEQKGLLFSLLKRSPEGDGKMTYACMARLEREEFDAIAVYVMRSPMDAAVGPNSVRESSTLSDEAEGRLWHSIVVRTLGLRLSLGSVSPSAVERRAWNSAVRGQRVVGRVLRRAAVNSMEMIRVVFFSRDGISQMSDCATLRQRGTVPSWNVTPVGMGREMETSVAFAGPPLKTMMVTGSSSPSPTRSGAKRLMEVFAIFWAWAVGPGRGRRVRVRVRVRKADSFRREGSCIRKITLHYFYRYVKYSLHASFLHS